MSQGIQIRQLICRKIWYVHLHVVQVTDLSTSGSSGCHVFKKEPLSPCKLFAQIITLSPGFSKNNIFRSLSSSTQTHSRHKILNFTRCLYFIISVCLLMCLEYKLNHQFVLLILMFLYLNYTLLWWQLQQRRNAKVTQKGNEVVLCFLSVKCRKNTLSNLWSQPDWPVNLLAQHAETWLCNTLNTGLQIIWLYIASATQWTSSVNITPFYL